MNLDNLKLLRAHMAALPASQIDMTEGLEVTYAKPCGCIAAHAYLLKNNGQVVDTVYTERASSVSSRPYDKVFVGWPQVRRCAAAWLELPSNDCHLFLCSNWPADLRRAINSMPPRTEEHKSVVIERLDRVIAEGEKDAADA